MTLPCPCCGAKNSEDAARCYACCATLAVEATGTVEDIPDPLLDNARHEVQKNPPRPYTEAERAQRIAMATAITLGAIVFMCTVGWILAIFALLIFPLGLILIAGMVAGLAAVWSWAFEKEKR